MKDKPDHHDAELVLRVYELRREPVMRESRSAINAKFLPKSYDDVLAVTKLDHPLNAAYRQTSSYWEMVYGFARNGIINADFLAESNGEGMLLFVKVEPYLERIRKDISPVAFRNAAWMVENSEVARSTFNRMRERIQKMT